MPWVEILLAVLSIAITLIIIYLLKCSETNLETHSEEQRQVDATPSSSFKGYKHKPIQREDVLALSYFPRRIKIFSDDLIFSGHVLLSVPAPTKCSFILLPNSSLNRVEKFITSSFRTSDRAFNSMYILLSDDEQACGEIFSSNLLKKKFDRLLTTHSLYAIRSDRARLYAVIRERSEQEITRKRLDQILIGLSKAAYALKSTKVALSVTPEPAPLHFRSNLYSYAGLASLIPLATTFWLTVNTYHPIFFSYYYVLGCVWFIAITIGLIFGLNISKKYSKKPAALTWGNAAFTITPFFMIVATSFFFVFINGYFDTSDPIEQTITISDVAFDRRSGRATSWRSDSETIYISAAYVPFRKMITISFKVGDKIKMIYHPGALGFEWLESMEVTSSQEPTNEKKLFGEAKQIPNYPQ